MYKYDPVSFPILRVISISVKTLAEYTQRGIVSAPDLLNFLGSRRHIAAAPMDYDPEFGLRFVDQP